MEKNRSYSDGIVSFIRNKPNTPLNEKSLFSDFLQTGFINKIEIFFIDFHRFALPK